jgi:PAS domain S-box-containing protein
MHGDTPGFADQVPGEMFRLLVASVADYAIFLLDPQGRIRTWNEGAQRIKGYTADEIVGQHFSLFYSPGDQAWGKPARGLQTAATEGRWEDEGWRVRKDGTRFWASVVLTALHDADGQLVGFAKVTRDLTERRKAEEERAQLLERERAAREAAEVALAQLRAIQAVTEVALAHLALDDLLPELLGRIRSLLAADTAAILLHDAAEPGTLVVRAAVGLEEEVARGVRLPLGRGFAGRVAAERRPIVFDDAEHAEVLNPLLRERGVRSLVGVPLLVEGRVLGVLHVGALRPRRFTADDATLLQATADRVALALEQQRLLAEAEAARAETAAAEEAVRLRDTFLAVAAHELQTPVTSLKGTTQLMLRQQLRGSLDPARLDAHLRRLDKSAGRLATLTADLLDVARLRTGQMPLAIAPLDLAALVGEAAARVRDGLDGGHRIVLTTSDNLGPVPADAARLEQVLANLLENAVKYSPGGGTIAVSARPSGAGVLVSVRDEGIGLPPDGTDAIFAPFGRAANAAARQIPGLGLGLYICRAIATRHGGKLWAESPGEGCGTTFHLWLPTAEASLPPAEPIVGGDAPFVADSRG